MTQPATPDTTVLVHGFWATPRSGTGWGAGAALVVGWARPAPWLLALLMVAILTAVWFFAVSRFLRADAWEES